MCFVSLESAYTKTIGYCYAINSEMVTSASILYLAIQDNKKNALITGICTMAYGALTYYEVISQAEIYETWYDYKKVFSVFAGSDEQSSFCVAHSLSFKDAPPLCLPAEGVLLSSLIKSRRAAAIYTALSLFRPVLLAISQQALSFSLCATLIKKWLKNSNNQLGLKMVDHAIAMEAREIIYQYSGNIVSGVFRRLTAIADILIAFTKIVTIYQMGEAIDSQEEDFHLLPAIALAISGFFVINILANIAFKKYTESSLKSQSLFKNDMTFNMENALQVECSQATRHEFKGLTALLTEMTKYQVIEEMLGTGISTVNMIFTHFFGFYLLGFSIPNLAKNPGLYFQIEDIGRLVSILSSNLWGIFYRLSSSAALGYSTHKVKKFIALIDKYERLLANRKNFTVTIDPHANLSCHLTMQYPDYATDSAASRVLLNNFQKEFVPGNMYAISGPSGSGKSSFFNALIGINPYVVGKVTITRPENIIYVPQRPIFKPQLSWMQTVLYPLDEQANATIELEAQILKWVSILGLESVYQNAKFSPVWVNTLSGGEAQRLSLLQALAKIFLCKKRSNDKVLLLLDEAMNALDPEIQEKTFQLLASQVQENAVIAIHIDHSDRNIIEARYAKDCIIYFDPPGSME